MTISGDRLIKCENAYKLALQLDTNLDEPNWSRRTTTMKQVINSKLYDTDNAERIATYCPVADKQDFNYLKETLYKTDSGNYFLYGTGGPNTKYAVRRSGAVSGSSEIVPLEEESALNWCEERTIDAEVIVEEFEHLIEKP